MKSLSNMQAAVYVAPNRLEVRSVPRPRIGPRELLIRTWGVGLCGTDINKIRHGSVAPGRVLGHELVGWLAEVGEGLTGFQVGDRVAATHHVPCHTCHYCLHGSYSNCQTFKTTDFDPGGFAEYVRLSAMHTGQTTFHLADCVPFDDAVFIEPLACCLRGVQRAGVRQGDVVWVIGAGSSGLLLALSALLLRATVVISELIPARMALARELGVPIVASPEQEDLPALVRAITDGRGADVVSPTVLTPEIVRDAVAAVRDGGTILLFAGEPGQAPVPLDGYGMWRREINVISSYSPDPGSLANAHDLITRRQVPVGRIPAQQVPLAEIGRGYEMAVSAQVTKVIVRLSEG